MQITDIKVRKLFDDGPMKAIVSVTFDGQLAVHDVKVIYARDKYFIVMPSRKNPDETYRDIVHPINAQFRGMLESSIISAYETAAKEAAEKAGADVIKLNRIVPIDENAVKAAAGYQRVVFAEEGVKNGGIGMQFLAQLALNGYKGETALRAIDGFVQQSSVDNALKALGLDADSLFDLING